MLNQGMNSVVEYFGKAILFKIKEKRVIHSVEGTPETKLLFFFYSRF